MLILGFFRSYDKGGGVLVWDCNKKRAISQRAKGHFKDYEVAVDINVLLIVLWQGKEAC